MIIYEIYQCLVGGLSSVSAMGLAMFGCITRIFMRKSSENQKVGQSAKNNDGEAIVDGDMNDQGRLSSASVLKRSLDSIEDEKHEHLSIWKVLRDQKGIRYFWAIIDTK